MKKIFWIIVLMLFFQLGQAQDNRTRGKKNKTYGKQYFLFGGGWNRSFMNLDGFNFILNRYNQTHQAGSEQFAQLDFLQGPSGALTFYGAKDNKKFTRYLFEIGFSGRWQKMTALDADIQQKQNVKLSLNSVHLRLGTMPALTTNFDIGLGIGLDAVLANMQHSIGDNALESLQQDVMLGASVFMPIYIGFGKKVPLSLGIRPYYQYQFKQLDFSELNKKLNPNTYSNDELGKQQGRLSNYGLELQLVIILGKKFLKG